MKGKRPDTTEQRIHPSQEVTVIGAKAENAGEMVIEGYAVHIISLEY